ncbi:MAG: YbhB/YbcL family Raf kinase inhibitor-like protein [Verrucomicrobiota bacterium]|nr:YbhB/YbcL family Raf kinase inhibitor-like protein [Verrucomicrobiota bacterium]
MHLTSSAFPAEGKIPSLYTCEGKNINPPLEFHDVPAAAKALVLLMDDPDVPRDRRPDGMWDHWVVFNIPPATRSIAEHTPPPGIQGANTDGKNSYYGPCPPDREHRYFFKLYALDTLLHLAPGATKKQVEHAMQGHILAQAELMGRYEKRGK